MTPNGHERTQPLRTSDPTELGGYRIVGRLGQGGMGTVYLAKDSADRNVAVKLIRPDLSDDEAFRRRFSREVRSARSVARFSTASVIDARLEGDPLFIVSEYVAGPTLAEAVKSEGPMAGGTLEGLAMGVAAALSAIHGAGVVHRDLKPANVLLSSVGPKVIDFGIARAMDADGSVTRSSQLMGTPAYLAPELISGDSVAPPADIFSWGCLVAFAGTGRTPFDGPTVPAVLHQIISMEPDLTGLDPHLLGLVRQALDKTPANRPTAQQLLNILIGQESPSPAVIDETVVRSWTPPSTNRSVIPDTGPRPAEPTGATPPAPGGLRPDGSPPAEPTTDFAQQRTNALPAPAARPPQPPYSGPSGPNQPGFGYPGSGYPPPGRQGGHGYNGQPPYGYPGDTRNGDFGGPTPPGGGVVSGRTPFPTKWVGAAALALVVAGAAVAGGIWLRGGPPVPTGTEFYSHDFAVQDNAWPDREFDPGSNSSWVGYQDDTFVVSADGDRQVSSGAYPEILGVPSRVLVSATAVVQSGPAYGAFGLSCFKYENDDDSTYYRAYVRVDGAEAEIRREAGEGGSRSLNRVGGDPVPGFAPAENGSGDRGADSPRNKLDFSCELDETAATMTLNLWVNGEHVLEAVDEQPLPSTGEGPSPGLAVAGGQGGRLTQVAFDDFALYQLGAVDGNNPIATPSSN
ncbi:serine/threonine-protein kinase [Nocardiopsis ansamitocini]|uniref:Protein kinase domain-containing protein n=1 Tax=Nocardiopsis ansamitocini TaxID=1670832 RepID=A0A9W6P5Q1_9ACTN|nr:serine/threonine-protein kinase [Nocardiopsis ansamitocini]GLU47905.1 hypothetical protein Nans01_22560 [Nocardiopsis ansamitocini]